MAENVSVGLLVRIEAKEGREADVEQFLQQGRSLVEEEPGTVRWFAIRFGPRSFGIFDAFPGRPRGQDRRAVRRTEHRAGRRDRGETARLT